MNGTAEVEVVVKYNVETRTHVKRFPWIPCATSTPVKRPLLMLNDVDNTSFRKCGNTEAKAGDKVLAVPSSKGKRPPDNINKNMIKKKLTKNGRGFNCWEDDDSDEDEIDIRKRENPSTRNLIIKSGLNQLNKRNNKRRSMISDKEADMLESEKNTAKERTSIVNNSNAGGIIQCENNTFKCRNMQKVLSDSNEKNKLKGKQHKKINKSLDAAFTRKLKFVSSFSEDKSKIKKNNDNSYVIKNKIDQSNNRTRTPDKMNKENSRLSMSHEIFSDSKEREFRDSLNLTAVDDEELSILSEKELVTKKINLTKQGVKSKAVENLQLSRPTRKRKSPKQYWLPQLEQNNEVLQNNNDCENVIKDYVVAKSCKELVIEKAEKDTCTETDIIGESNHPCESAHVKVISEMNFEENCEEDENKKFSVALGWQFSSFKCCALKIGAKCEASGRTKTKNSHIGGVLLKGRLSLKIGETEVKMKGGEMFHIPPLTDWRALNIGRIDCLLYYWVGKM